MRTAAAVRERKNRHPELYCKVPSCLWLTGGATGKPCRKHPVRPEVEELRAKIEAYNKKLREES